MNPPISQDVIPVRCVCGVFGEAMRGLFVDEGTVSFMMELPEGWSAEWLQGGEDLDQLTGVRFHCRACSRRSHATH